MKFGKLLGLIGLVGVLWILWKIRQILLLLFAAIVFATVINQVVRQLQKFLLPRAVAVAITLTSLIGLLVGLGWFIGPNVADQIPEYTFLAEQGLEKIQAWFNHFRFQLTGIFPEEALTQTELSDVLPQLTQLSSNWVSQLLKFFTGSLDFFLNLLLVLVTTVMLLANPASYRRTLLLGFPKFYRSRADNILTQCEESLTGWATGVLFNMFVITICSAIGLMLIGVPLPMVNAIIAGLLTFIPNIGPLLSVVPPVLMALSVHPWMALAVLALYFAIQQIEGLLLTPLVMKKQVALLPAIALFSQIIFTVFFGFLGLFLALPMVVVLQVWLRELLVKDVLNRWPAPRPLMRSITARNQNFLETNRTIMEPLN